MTDSELMQRLEKLERDNRRLKALALSTLALAAALGGIYAAQPASRTVRAREFEVVDDTGTSRIKMGVHEGMPEILLSDAQGTPHLGLYINKARWPIVWLTGAVVPYDKTLHLPLGATEVSAMQSNIMLYADPSSGEPTIRLSDKRDFMMDLGATRLEKATGESERTSAASITMFANGKKHQVIWRAP